MGWRLRFGLAACQRTRNPSRFPFARCARPVTELLPACPIAPLENEGMTSKCPEGKFISSHLYPSGDKTGADRETGSSPRVFSGRRLAVGAKRRGLTRLPRSVQSSRKKWDGPMHVWPVPSSPFLLMLHVFGAGSHSQATVYVC